ncbi:MAG TPA: hypothetical protein VMU87_04220 [Stellaceae bacterium]|nr:hypothetical protein [Stellaceae bacterium]
MAASHHPIRHLALLPPSDGATVAIAARALGMDRRAVASRVVAGLTS